MVDGQVGTERFVSQWGASTYRADVVIVAAIRLEFDAVLAVEAGAVPGSAWETIAGPSDIPVAVRSFTTESGGPPLRIAAASLADMRTTAAIHALLHLVEAFRPHCVGICGVCSGRSGRTQLGDVIAAERLFHHDPDAQPQDSVQQSLATYKLRDDWSAALDGFDAAVRFRDAAWFQRRPFTTEWREHRALIALRDGVAEPWKFVEPGLGVEHWKRIVAALRERKLLAAEGRALTDRGRQVADDLLFEHQGELPDLSPTGGFQPFRIHVAAIGSGPHIREHQDIWGVISPSLRKTLGVELEGVALGELTQRRDRLDTVVMKGVMDLADHGRDDHFKEFAARASGECLLWLVRQRVAPAPATEEGDEDAPAPVDLPAAGEDRSRRTSDDLLDYGVERQRHGGIVGREAMLVDLDSWLVDDDSDRWVVVTGGPGMGKSAILAAWLARREAAGTVVPHHFIRRGLYGWDEPAKIVGSLAAQIERWYPAQRDPDAAAESRLVDLLTRVSVEQLVPRGGRLVL